MRIVSALIRGFACLLVAFRLFAVSLAGGADLLVPHIPAICLLGLIFTPKSAVERGGFLMILLLATLILLGVSALTYEVISNGLKEIHLAELVTFVMFGIIFAAGARNVNASSNISIQNGRADARR